MMSTFTSFHYPFIIDPVLGKLGEEKDYTKHVEQLMMQVLLTAPGERINRPDFGCGIKRLVFAPGGEIAATLAQSIAKESLSKWLGTVIDVHTVTAHAFDSTLEIKIAYTILTQKQQRYLNIKVTP